MKLLRCLSVGIALTLLAVFPLPSPAADDADAPVKALLPPASQHTFIPIDPAWSVKITYQDIRPGAYVEVTQPTAEQKKVLYKLVRYQAPPGQSVINGVIKDLIYFPTGALCSEVDNT